MSFLFYCSWHNKNEWLKEIKKKFKKQKIFLIKDKPNFSKSRTILSAIPSPIHPSADRPVRFVNGITRTDSVG